MLRKTFPFALLLVFAGAQAAPLFLPPSSAPASFQTAVKPGQKTGKLVGSFDKAEMVAMVTELSLYIPQNPNLAYPIDCDFVEKNQVNAYATVTDGAEGEKPHSVMRILTGILKFIDDACAANLEVGLDPSDPNKKVTLKPGDERNLLRAVVAHELAHLSKGHVLRSKDAPKGRDMGVLYTRETEYEADAVGAAALQRAGYSRTDAEHMLMMLEATNTGGVAENLLGDHADGKRRALAVAENPAVLRAMVEFDLGLAYSEVRAFAQATTAFDRAAAREPKLAETYTNSTLTALQEYYQKLPGGVTMKWFRPDFGPLLKIFSAPKGNIVDQDRVRYADAQRRATIALQKSPENPRTLEVVGLVGVLNPDGTASLISDGLKSLQKALSLTMNPEDRLRIANNMAVGYQRSNDVSKGIDTLVSTLKTTGKYSAAVASNLGLQPLPATFGKDATVVAGTMYDYLASTPKEADDYAMVSASYAEVTKKYNVPSKKLPDTGAELSLCQVFTVNTSGQDITLLELLTDTEKKLGKGEILMGILASGENRVRVGEPVGLFEAKFRGDTSGIYQNRAGDKELVRFTTYVPGAYVELRPRIEGQGQAFRVTIGMKESELYKRLPEDSGASARLFRVGQLEEWTYFPGLNFGVQIKDGVISGLTATPAK